MDYKELILVLRNDMHRTFPNFNSNKAFPYPAHFYIDSAKPTNLYVKLVDILRNEVCSTIQVDLNRLEIIVENPFDVNRAVKLKKCLNERRINLNIVKTYDPVC